jgi:hypothetical protein
MVKQSITENVIASYILQELLLAAGKNTLPTQAALR